MPDRRTAQEALRRLVVDVPDWPEQGVTFKSHIDGSLHHMSPERSIEIHLRDQVRRHRLRARVVLRERCDEGDDQEVHTSSLRVTSWNTCRPHVYTASSEAWQTQCSP